MYVYVSARMVWQVWAIPILVEAIFVNDFAKITKMVNFAVFNSPKSTHSGRALSSFG